MATSHGHRRAKSDLNLGSLLRLFKSGFFDSWITVSYLYRYPETPGVHDYLVNELYKLSDEDVEFYLFQLCNLLVQKQFSQTDALERFLLDKCSKSIHFALQVAWILQSTVEDPAIKNQTMKEYCKRLREDVEIACVNVRRPLPRTVRDKLKEKSGDSPGGVSASSSTPKYLGIPKSEPVSKKQLLRGSSPGTPSPGAEITSFDSYMNCFLKEEAAATNSNAEEVVDFALGKHDRYEYFNRLLGFVDQLQHLSDKLRSIPIDLRQKELNSKLEILNRSLLVNGTGLYLPICQASHPHFCIVHIVVEDAKVLNSRDRVPFLISLEVLTSSDPCSTPDLQKVAASYKDTIMEIVHDLQRKEMEAMALQSQQAEATAAPAGIAGKPGATQSPDEGSGASALDSHEKYVTDTEPLDEDLQKELVSDNYGDQDENKSDDAEKNSASVDKEDGNKKDKGKGKLTAEEELKRGLERLDLAEELPIDEKGKVDISMLSSEVLEERMAEERVSYNASDELKPVKIPIAELWEEKKKRIRKSSPFGHLPQWDLFSVIVKFGDDLRQEQLALQLIFQFQKIFKEANLPIYLRPYSILITSSESGLVETVLDTVSLHQLKKNTPGYTTLANYYKTVYEYPSSKYKLAERNYVESMAGYSIITYLLQIKDRHNGNILLDAEGHIVHIDFGFMLSNSPGNLNFESAPFKLTQEFIDVMGGVDSNVFQVSVCCFDCRSNHLTTVFYM